MKHTILISALMLIAFGAHASTKHSGSSWCEYRQSSELSHVDTVTNTYGYVLKKGTLSGNLERLVESFYPANNGVVNRTERHMVVSDTCIEAHSIELVIQRIIEPYRLDGVEIHFSHFSNDMFALYYANDDEFKRYHQGKQ